MPRRDIGPLAPYRFFKALKPRVRIITCIIWNVAFVVSYFFEPELLGIRQGAPGWSVFLVTLAGFLFCLGLWFSDEFRERMLVADVSLEALTGPWWLVTIVMGGMSLVTVLGLLGIH